MQIQTALFVPTVAITRVENETVSLSVSKDQIEHQDWNHEPAMTDRHREISDEDDRIRTADIDGAITQEAGDRMHIAVSEEHLDVSTREVERGRVNLQQDGIQEEKSLAAPLREEEVRVERYDVTGRPTRGDVPADAFQEQDIEIPLRGEEVVVTKHARVREEVDISKCVREREVPVGDTVRRAKVDIDRDGDLDDRRQRP